MKRLMLSMFAAVLFIVPVAWAAEELDEKMPKVDYQLNYVDHRDAGHEAMESGNYAEAIGHFNKAADNTAFAYVRAIHYGNIGLCYRLNAEEVKSRSDVKEAIEYYKEALYLMNQADSVCAEGCVHETDCTKKRSFFRGAFERGIKAAKKYLKR